MKTLPHNTAVQVGDANTTAYATSAHTFVVQRQQPWQENKLRHRLAHEENTFHNWPLFRVFLYFATMFQVTKSGRLLHYHYHPKGTAKNPEQDKQRRIRPLTDASNPIVLLFIPFLAVILR